MGPPKDGSVGVSVIVPCRNEAGAIDAFLASALAQRGVCGGYEVIIADGASVDGTRKRLDEWSRRDRRVRVIDNPGLFVSSGLNRAIESARGDVIARMDVHSEYATDYLAECLRTLRETGADNVGGPARTRAGRFFQRANAAAYHSWFSVGGARFHDSGYTGPVDTVPYGCWRTKTLHELGLFDETLVRNQDDELNFRLIRRGGRIWQSAAIRSWYSPRDSAAGLFRQYFQYGYWKVRVLRKHRVPASIRQLVPALMVVSGVVLGLMGLLVRPAWSLLIGLAAIYILLSVVASIRAAHDFGDWRVLPILPYVFLIYHLSYGLGFLSGLMDALFKRRPAPGVISLSR